MPAYKVLPSWRIWSVLPCMSRSARSTIRAGDEANTLVTEADAEDGKFGTEVADDVVGDAAFARGAGAGGDNDVRGFEVLDLIDGYFVVAEDFHRRLRETSPNF